MLLMVIAYTLVKLHGHGVRPVLFMWRPFHYFFARFRREWDLRTSIIDAFVTFFILSTTKLFSVSFHLLMPTELFTPYGDSKPPRLSSVNKSIIIIIIIVSFHDLHSPIVRPDHVYLHVYL